MTLVVTPEVAFQRTRSFSGRQWLQLVTSSDKRSFLMHTLSIVHPWNISNPDVGRYISLAEAEISFQRAYRIDKSVRDTMARGAPDKVFETFIDCVVE
jgi:hypothetical protein